MSQEKEPPTPPAQPAPPNEPPPFQPDPDLITSLERGARPDESKSPPSREEK